MNRPRPRSRCVPLAALAAGGLLAALAAGCESTAVVQLRREVDELRETVRKKDDELIAKQASLEESNRQLQVARGLSDEDLKRIFYPEKIIIDKLTGGADYDGQPGDDGITVYFRPVDRDGDTIKVAGDVTIQLYDLAAPPNQNFIAEYKVPVDQLGRLWYGKILASHYAVKCPWPHGPPAHPEVTVRLVFVDYLTKRVVAAQSTARFSPPAK